MPATTWQFGAGTTRFSMQTTRLDDAVDSAERGALARNTLARNALRMVRRP